MTRGARTADEATAGGAGDLAPVTYNYAFFHLIFALASTYIAMLMTGAARLPCITPCVPSPVEDWEVGLSRKSCDDEWMENEFVI